MRRRISIKNETTWRTRDLRRFIVRVVSREFDRGEKPFFTVRVGYNRQKDRGSVSGSAVIGGSSIRILLPSLVVDRVDLAGVIAHECAHARGLNHKQMRGAARWRRVGNWRELYAWADSLPLEKAAPKVKVRPTGAALASAKIMAITERLKKWAAKKKRAETALKSLKAKLRYYERRAAAMGPSTTATKGA
jgi:hypothetical protein